MNRKANKGAAPNPAFVIPTTLSVDIAASFVLHHRFRPGR